MRQRNDKAVCQGQGTVPLPGNAGKKTDNLSALCVSAALQQGHFIIYFQVAECGGVQSGIRDTGKERFKDFDGLAYIPDGSIGNRTCIGAAVEMDVMIERKIKLIYFPCKIGQPRCHDVILPEIQPFYRTDTVCHVQVSSDKFPTYTHNRLSAYQSEDIVAFVIRDLFRYPDGFVFEFMKEIKHDNIGIFLLRLESKYLYGIRFQVIVTIPTCSTYSPVACCKAVFLAAASPIFRGCRITDTWVRRCGYSSNTLFNSAMLESGE